MRMAATAEVRDSATPPMSGWPPTGTSRTSVTAALDVSRNADGAFDSAEDIEPATEPWTAPKA